MSWLRVAVAIGFGVTLYAAGAWAALPALVFIAAVLFHDRVAKRVARVERAIAYFQRGIERLDGDWAGKGSSGEAFDEASHPYARDLDLFGRGSLFELVCSARTANGEATLARWLKTPAGAAEVRARQDAVRELTDRVTLREALALDGADVRAEVDGRSLIEWAARAPSFAQPWIRPLLFVLSLFAVVTTLGWIAFGFGWLPIACVVLTEAVVLRWLKEPVERVTLSVDRPGKQLAVLSVVLARLEAEAMKSEKLVALQKKLLSDGKRASARIAALGRLVDLLHQQGNQFFLPFALLLLWGPHVALLIERWRAESGRAIADWLTALGELEALSSLSGYAFEHPNDPFPEIVEDGATYDGEGLVHPLLLGSVAVPNEVRLVGELRLYLVSGSNMSGKSTLLRTIGVNAVLALSGAPVRATRLRLSPLSIGATLRVQDSLAEGVSRFYAEIRRLRQLVELAATPPPLLFLLDEILHGTNSHDRRLGAEAVIRELLSRGAIGLCTTHDLALAQVADALRPRAENVHFEDTLRDGQLQFDYRMRPGVVRKSNALELMRAVGLPVPP